MRDIRTVLVAKVAGGVPTAATEYYRVELTSESGGGDQPDAIVSLTPALNVWSQWVAATSPQGAVAKAITGSVYLTNIQENLLAYHSYWGGPEIHPWGDTSFKFSAPTGGNGSWTEAITEKSNLDQFDTGDGEAGDNGDFDDITISATVQGIFRPSFSS
jgi:hypothetical protein